MKRLLVPSGGVIQGRLGMVTISSRASRTGVLRIMNEDCLPNYGLHVKLIIMPHGNNSFVHTIRFWYVI